MPGYPIPDEAKTTANYIEGGRGRRRLIGDRHLLIIDRDRWLLYETFATRGMPRLALGSGLGRDLRPRTNDRRPEGWTSADAAGLAIFPGLVRYDEVFGSAEITHAFRVTTRATNGYVWPASHRAGSNASAPPLGARLRLKASKDISTFTPEVQRIFRAMKRYGLIVADNGSDMYISGTMDGRWNNDVLNPAFRALTADDFEVVQLGWARTGPGGAHRTFASSGSRGRRLPAYATCRTGTSGPGPSPSRSRHASRNRPAAGAVSAAASTVLGSTSVARRPAASPRPTAASTPTIRRTIFHRKCEPWTRIRRSAPASAISTAIHEHQRRLLRRVVGREALRSPSCRRTAPPPRASARPSSGS